MSLNITEVEQALLALDQRDRAAVIQRGLRSLDADDGTSVPSDIDEAWRLELEQRIEEIESGAVELLDAGESHSQLRAELAARQK